MFFDANPKTVQAITKAHDNVKLIQVWSANLDLQALKSNTLKRYAIERAFIALDSAIRDLPENMLSHFNIPSRSIAGFRNALAHSYEDILDERVMLTIKEDLPALEQILIKIQAEISTGKDPEIGAQS